MKLTACGVRTELIAAHRPPADRGLNNRLCCLPPRICLLVCCNLHRCSHNSLHMGSKQSIHFKNDVIVYVVRIRRENFQHASNDTAKWEAKLFPNALQGLLMKSMTKFRRDFIALFLPLILKTSIKLHSGILQWDSGAQSVSGHHSIHSPLQNIN